MSRALSPVTRRSPERFLGSAENRQKPNLKRTILQANEKRSRWLLFSYSVLEAFAVRARGRTDQDRSLEHFLMLLRPDAEPTHISLERRRTLEWRCLQIYA